MQKYEVLQRAGSGNFSDVYKAKDLRTGETVAIKEMKRSEDVEELAMRELRILSALKHPNIIELREVVSYEGDVKVVFEYVEENLLELYESSKMGVNENQIKCILYQTAFALEYLHSEKRIIHRDIKPENILIDRKKAMVKLIDFGLAKEEHLATTDYVATRWYRSPENLIGLRKSTTAIDIFALACVIVELFTLNPLFPGDDTVDQLHKVFAILGTPTEISWPAGYHQMRRKGLSVLPKSKVSLKQIMPAASNDLVDLLEEMLVLNPERRIRARDIMLHPFFEKVERVIPGSVHREARKYLEQVCEKQVRIPVVKSLSPNTTASNVRNSPMREFLVNKNEFGRESNFDPNAFNNRMSLVNRSIYSNNGNNGNETQVPIPHLQPTHNSFVPMESKYKFVYPPTISNNSSVFQSLVPTTQHPRQARLVSFPNAPTVAPISNVTNISNIPNIPNFHTNAPNYKKSPLPSKREENQYLGIDPQQLENIKRKIQLNEGMWSPKYNVRYFKEPKEDSRSRRNLSVDVPRSRVVIHKSKEQKVPVPAKGKNMFPPKMAFRGT